MAHYTTTMWWMKDELGLSISDLFPSDFNYYDPKNRERFMNLFYGHYFDREIGFETYSLFKHKLKVKLNLIMPKYQNMFDTFKLVNDPLNEYEEIEKYTKDQKDNIKSDGSGSTNSDYENKSKSEQESILSDTPQGYLKPNDLYDHATSVNVDRNNDDTTQKSNSKSSTTSTSNKDSNEIMDKTKSGRRTNQMELIQKYQDMYRNLDEMIIHECKDLFMGVF